MLVEKNHGKNWIKPVILFIAVIVAIMSLVKIGLFICDYDSGKYAFLEVPIFLALFFIIVKIGIEKIDFVQVVKVEDLSTLNDYELWEYRKNFGDDISIKTKYEEEYLRCCAEMSTRKKSPKVKIETIEINKSYFNEIMKYISDSNVIPTRVKEFIKEDILGTYNKRDEHDLPHEYFITSQENAAVFKAAYNEVETVNKGYGDYGFIYEYENWKWQYGKGKKCIKIL